MVSRDSVNFETTSWTELAQLNGPNANAALAALCAKYWQPLYAFARKRTNDVHHAQDLTQGFFQHIISKDTLRLADRDRGRFRTFLLAAFRNFTSNEHARATAQRRGGKRVELSLDFAGAEETFLESHIDRATPEQQFERSWTLQLIQNVIGTLRQEFELQGESDRFAILESFLVTDTAESNSTAADRLGISPDALRKAVSRLRQRFRILLKAEVSQLVHDSDDIEDEIQQMFRALAV